MNAIFIQCRLASKRLPCKAMLDLNGKTILARVVERMKLANLPVYILTTKANEDDIIELEGSKLKVDGIYRGEINNVRKRFYDAAKKFKVDVIARVTADNPLSDPRFVTKAFKFIENGYSYSRVDPYKCPDGTNIEVFKFEELENSIGKDPSQHNLYDMEHVTPEIISRLKNKDKLIEFDINEPALTGSHYYHLGIDTLNDYVKLKLLLKIFNAQDYKKCDFLDLIMTHVNNNNGIIQKGRRYAL